MSENTITKALKRWIPIYTDKRYIAPIFITLILIAAELSYGILEGYPKLAAAIFASMGTELILGKLVTGKWRNLSSAYVSGISIGILIRSPMIWPYALASIITITSKYVLRYKGRHIWNPSNFGVVALLLLASNSVAVLSVQWGNNIWVMAVIWVLGFIIVWRVDRLHISAVYIISFLFFSLIRSWISGNPFLGEVAPITGPMYQLFTFFMITDPKTTVSSKWGQYVVPFAIAAVEMVLRLVFHAVYAPFYALFIVGPIAMVIEITWKDMQQKRAVKTAAT
ncbi:MAG TPA: hypothetical protein VKA34_00350 [Balneolales bacterium]|nr:hypothetical protein [Balneolales bacterium]